MPSTKPADARLLNTAPGARQAIWRNDQPDCALGTGGDLAAAVHERARHWRWAWRQNTPVRPQHSRPAPVDPGAVHGQRLCTAAALHMLGLKHRNLAALAWAAVALTPIGWFYGFAFSYSHLGDVTDVGMMTGGVVLFAVVPTRAFILAIYAARAGHRSWQDRHDGVRAAAPAHAYHHVCLHLDERRVDRPGRGHGRGGRGAGFRLDALPQDRRDDIRLLLLGLLVFSAWQSGG